MISFCSRSEVQNSDTGQESSRKLLAHVPGSRTVSRGLGLGVQVPAQEQPQVVFLFDTGTLESPSRSPVTTECSQYC